MKRFLAVSALLVLSAAPAMADQRGGIAGHIVDATTHAAVAGVPVFIYRMPVRQGDAPVSAVRTDKHGGFADITLPVGRYLVATRDGTRSQGCDVDDVYPGNVMHVTIAVGSNRATCTGAHIRTAVVDPGLTTDMYLIGSGR